MKTKPMDIQIISAPSILGLKPTGVELFGRALLETGLAECLQSEAPVISIPDLNHLYSDQRDAITGCLNARAVKKFSLSLCTAIAEQIDKGSFPLVLGGDCSILIGALAAVKQKGNYGLIFMDAHADFYLPEQSPTGEIADMDLAIVTGRGPEMLSNIKGLRPYIQDEHIVHIGQRDWDETKKYGSQDIKGTAIMCYDLKTIQKDGISNVAVEMLQKLDKMDVRGYWIHFDTDVLSDDINPAVDYRIPGGLQFRDTELLIRAVLQTKKVVGMSITIFNPELDHDNSIASNISKSICRAFGG